MMSRVWKGVGLAVVLLMLLAVVPVAAQPTPPDPAPASNTLRIYGNEGEDAEFPYSWDDPTAPFDLTHAEAPPKDFVVWNPAYMLHKDNDFTRMIKVNGADANQKVHLRQWYVPEMYEPLGVTEDDDLQGTEGPLPHIVKEYTFSLLDVDDNPEGGEPGETTAFAFPIADRDPHQMGLDCFDANGDGVFDITVVAGTNLQRGDWTYDAGVQLQTDVLAVPVDGEIQFLDHSIEVVNVDTDHNEVAVKVFYGGSFNDEEQIPGTSLQVLKKGQLLSAGRANVSVDATANLWDKNTWDNLEPVYEPWFLYVDGIVQNQVLVRVGRLLTRGESFFVDGAEYAVSAIFTEMDGQPSLDEGAAFKYITIRNPLCKCEAGGDCDVLIDPITVYKRCVAPNTYIPFLPPFNMEHDIIDDVNIPTLNQVFPSSLTLDPDKQSPDNQVDEGFTPPYFPAFPLGWGEYSYIHELFNTIEKRRLTDQPAALEYYIEEARELRFTTNLLEEKFTEPGDLVARWEDDEVIELYDEWSFGEPKPVWMLWPIWGVGVTWDEYERLGIWEADRMFCGPDNSFIPPTEVRAYVNGVQVPVLVAGNYQGTGYVMLDTAANHVGPFAEVTLDYCYVDEVGGQYWQWINIDTNPDHYTEFVMPQWDDAPAGLADYDYGDYMLVSSFMTEDDVRVKFQFDAAVGLVNSADVYVNDAAYNKKEYGVDANSLRLYGRDEPAVQIQASSTYDSPKGPFDLTSAEAPPKDFLVWNPAYMNHTRNDFLRQIKVNNRDANQKVHLRQWYVPGLEEPLGEVWTDQEPVASDHIIKEYTYLLLDTDNNPVMAREGISRFVFPVSDKDDDQIGLDSFDYDNDGEPDVVEIRDIYELDSVPHVNLSTGLLAVEAGDEIEFLDHKIEITGVDATPSTPDQGEMTLNVFYGGAGFGFDERIKSMWPIDEGQTLSAGRKNVLNQDPVPVTRPWYMDVEAVIGETAYVRVGRHLKEGESFFVDGAEYFVAKLFTQLVDTGAEPTLDTDTQLDELDRNPGTKGPRWWGTATQANADGTYFIDVDEDGSYTDDVIVWVEGTEVPVQEVDRDNGWVRLFDVYPADADVQMLYTYDFEVPPEDVFEIKYITIRNPLCKCPTGVGCTVDLEALTVEKACIAPMEMIPFLPPFNMEHDIIDDVNIPAFDDVLDLLAGVGAGQLFPDFQLWDNVLAEPETCGVEVAGAKFGCESLIHAFFNTIEERWIEDVPATEEYYIVETWEKRFKTNLLEEKWKFTEAGDQEWQWINIETKPWDYTEFVLPLIPEVEPLETLGFVGDYILVSSWTTEDSPSPIHGGDVRMKFSYDASDGTGIYVNYHGMECIGDFNGDGVVNMDDVWPLINRWNLKVGQCKNSFCYEAVYDLNNDGIIDLDDIMIVVANWGPCQ